MILPNNQNSRFITLISFVGFAIGIIVIIGWIFHIEVLKRLIPTFVAMNPMSAVAFICLSISLFLISKEKSKYLSLLLACVVFLIGFIKLLSFVGFDIGIDQLLFRDQLTNDLTGMPNRMAPNTAFNFVLLGGSLVLLLLGLVPAVIQIAILISFILSGLATIGYLYNLTALYKVASFIPMAIHTAITFIILGLGTLIVLSAKQSLLIFDIAHSISDHFNNLKIRDKLIYSFGLLILFSSLFSIITYYLIGDIQNNQLPARANTRGLRISELEMRKYEHDFLLNDIRDQNNKEFFLEGKSRSIEYWKEQYQIFSKNLEDLNTFLVNNNHKDNAEELIELKEYISDYNFYFLEIVNRYQTRGFYEYGLEGTMREAAHELEDSLRFIPNLHVLLLQTRRHEKDFLLRSNITYVQDFDKSLSNLRKGLQGNPKLLAVLDQYELSFRQIVELEKEVGLTANTGLIGKMNIALAKSDEIIDRQANEIIAITDTTISQIERLLLSLAILFAIIGIALSVIIARTIAESLKKMEAAAQRIAKGNLNEQITITSKDEIGSLASSLNDMTKELRDSRRILTEAKAKDEAILEGIGDGVFVIDSKENITLFNHASSLISGFTAEEAIGKPYKEILKFVTEDDDTLKDEFIKKAFGGQKAEMVNHTMLIKKDGSRVAVADSAAPIQDINGAVQGVVVVFRDVTHEREIDKAKSEFVSLASHQLRTPLSAINWYTEMLMAGDAGKLTADQKKYLDEVYQANQRMVDLVNSLLNVSRIDLGTFVIEPEKTNVVDIAKSIVQELEPQVFKQKQKLTEHYDDKIPEMNVDKKLMRMIMQNLLSNAIKYTPEAGSVDFALKVVDKYLQIEVKDTGFGIPKEQQGSIFSKLFRADNVRAKDTEGTGLGLYIIKSIVDNTKGKIWFESEVDKGTTFYVQIPLSGMAKKEGSKALD